MAKTQPPLRAIRQYCLECSDGSRKYVTSCPCDGVHSAWCPLWPYRFGLRVRTAASQYGADFLNPAKNRSARVNLEDLANAG